MVITKHNGERLEANWFILCLDSYEINSLSILVMDNHSEMIPACFVNNDAIIILREGIYAWLFNKHFSASGSLFSKFFLHYVLSASCLNVASDVYPPPDGGHAVHGLQVLVQLHFFFYTIKSNKFWHF